MGGATREAPGCVSVMTSGHVSFSSSLVANKTCSANSRSSIQREMYLISPENGINRSFVRQARCSNSSVITGKDCGQKHARDHLENSSKMLLKNDKQITEAQAPNIGVRRRP